MHYTCNLVNNALLKKGFDYNIYMHVITAVTPIEMFFKLGVTI